MNKIIKNLLFFVVLLMFVFSSNTFSQSDYENEEPLLSGEVGVEFFTTYLWRGIDYFRGVYDYQEKDQQVFNINGFTINPYITIATKFGFYVNLWTSFSLTSRDLGVKKDGNYWDLETFDELDFTIGYVTPGEYFDEYGELEIGFTYFTYLYGLAVYVGEGVPNIRADGFLIPEWEVYIKYTAPVPYVPVGVSMHIDDEVNYYIALNATYAWEPLDWFALEPSLVFGTWLRPHTIQSQDLHPLAGGTGQDSLYTENWSHLDVNLTFLFFPIGELTIYIVATASLRFFYFDDVKRIADLEAVDGSGNPVEAYIDIKRPFLLAGIILGASYAF